MVMDFKFNDRGMIFIPQMFNNLENIHLVYHTFVFHINEFTDKHYQAFEKFIVFTS